MRLALPVLLSFSQEKNEERRGETKEKGQGEMFPVNWRNVATTINEPVDKRIARVT